MSLKIIHIIPGSGGSFYCGNCLRDSKYFESLRKMGHDVVKIPMYLPLFSDEHDLNDVPVFYGAISIYLKQLYPVFRNAPAWFDQILNSKPLLKLAASMAGSTRARGLEDMTISMLQGEKGKQHEELDRMTDWMKDHYKPDVIHLSNALLLGLAPKLKEKLKVPIVCSLQDEDVWVDIMTDPNRKRVWELMSEDAAYVDHFISVSDYFKTVSIEKMKIPQEKITSIHIGVDPDEYPWMNSGEKKRNIGFISRMSYDNGLDIFVDSFIILKKQPEYKDVKLIVTGGKTGDDKSYIRKIKRKLRKNGLLKEVDFHKEFEGEGRKDFFAKTAILSVPVRNGEAFGIYIVESLASGIPVVQPALGAFPEVLATSGGGIIYEENNPEHLANAMRQLLDEPARLSQLSLEGRKGVELHLNIHLLANQMMDVYRKVTATSTIIPL